MRGSHGSSRGRSYSTRDSRTGDAPQHDDWDSIALQALVKRATEHMETHGTVSLDNWLYWIKDIDATLRHVPSPTEEMLLYLRKQLLV